MLKIFYDLLSLLIDSRYPQIRRKKRAEDRRRQRKAQRLRERKMPKQPKAEPIDDNRPGECQCPRCLDKSDGFRWMARERTWRCSRCRVPVRFMDGQAVLNFSRDMVNADAGGWRIPDSTLDVQRCVRHLGVMLLDEPQPVVKTRAVLAHAGYDRKTVDRAVSFLRIKQKQRERPGPVYFHLPDKAGQLVAKWVLEEFASVITHVLPKPPDDTQSDTQPTPASNCAENGPHAREPIPEEQSIDN
jgi:hypothetical protein